MKSLKARSKPFSFFLCNSTTRRCLFPLVTQAASRKRPIITVSRWLSCTCCATGKFCQLRELAKYLFHIDFAPLCDDLRVLKVDILNNCLGQDNCWPQKETQHGQFHEGPIIVICIMLHNLVIIDHLSQV